MMKQSGNAMVETMAVVALIVVIMSVAGGYGIKKLDEWLIGHDKQVQVCK